MHLFLFALLCASDPGFSLVRVAEYATGAGHGAEIVSVQSSSARAVLLNADAATVEVLDLEDPTAPRLRTRHELELASGEHPTSVAFHPSQDYYVVAVQAAGVWASGRIEARAASDGARLASIPCGIGPDSVVFDASGRMAAAACEGEGYDFDPATRTFRSPPGSVTWIDLSQGPARAKSTTLLLPEPGEQPGMVATGDARRIERTVDWNRNGRIDAEVDFDGDGKLDGEGLVVGTYEGAEVRADEKHGETFELALVGRPASAVEPECLVFSAGAARLYVTIQELNAVAVIDVAAGKLAHYFGAGVVQHVADVKKDGRVDFTGELVALREPDGIALTPDGRCFVTGDEGDTTPKASKVVAPGRAGGGRTLSVFDAERGTLVGDTGNQLDAAAAAAGVYPDARSDNKGSEPEMLVTFVHQGRAFAAVGLERAGAVALVDLGDPAQAPAPPKVLGVTPCGADAAASAKCEPEGLALHRRANGELYVLSANEGSGTVTVFALRGP